MNEWRVVVKGAGVKAKVDLRIGLLLLSFIEDISCLRNFVFSFCFSRGSFNCN